MTSKGRRLEVLVVGRVVVRAEEELGPLVPGSPVKILSLSLSSRRE